MIKRTLAALLIAAALLIPAGASEAKTYPSAAQLAHYIIRHEPGICHTIIVGIDVYGYRRAEHQFAIGYGRGRPRAAAVFAALFIQCS